MNLDLYRRFFGVCFVVLAWLAAFSAWAITPTGQWHNPIGAFILCMLLLDQVLRARRERKKETT